MRDSANMNEDWLRTRSLDLYYNGRTPQNLEELTKALPSDMDIDHFMSLPAAKAVPIKILVEWHNSKRGTPPTKV